jgi:hypothetical protein
MNEKILLDTDPNDSVLPIELSMSVIVLPDGTSQHTYDYMIPITQPMGTIYVSSSLSDANCQSSTGYTYTFEVTGDNDGDGYFSDVDCDDTNPAVYPGAPDIVCDVIVMEYQMTAMYLQIQVVA